MNSYCSASCLYSHLSIHLSVINVWYQCCKLQFLTDTQQYFLSLPFFSDALLSLSCFLTFFSLFIFTSSSVSVSVGISVLWWGLGEPQMPFLHLLLPLRPLQPLLKVAPPPRPPPPPPTLELVGDRKFVCVSVCVCEWDNPVVELNSVVIVL